MDIVPKEVFFVGETLHGHLESLTFQNQPTGRLPTPKPGAKALFT